MKKIVVIAAFALGLAGCANLQNAYTVLTSSTVSPAAVNVAVNTFDALEATATNYLRLPKCSTATTRICRSPSATKQIIPMVRQGRFARNQLETFIASHPGQLGPQGLYDALMASVNTLQSIYGQYNISGN